MRRLREAREWRDSAVRRAGDYRSMAIVAAGGRRSQGVLQPRATITKPPKGAIVSVGSASASALAWMAWPSCPGGAVSVYSVVAASAQPSWARSSRTVRVAPSGGA